MKDRLEIKDGWFNIAGDIYGWTNDGLDKRGVGITRHLLDSGGELSDELTIVVYDKEYTVNKKKAIDFVNKYKSVKAVGKEGKVGVISKDILEEKHGG